MNLKVPQSKVIGGHRMRCLIGCAILTIFILILVLPQYAYAYIDPGVGSYVLQMIIVALVAGLFVSKLFFNKIKTFFVHLFARKKNK